MDPDEQIREFAGDRTFTYWATFVSLAVGVALAGVIAAVLLAVRQPLVTDSAGGVIWSLGMFMIPLAGLLAVVILAWAVFHLPVVLARRRGLVLDPTIWPLTGAIAVGVVAVAIFAVAIFLGLI